MQRKNLYISIFGLLLVGIINAGYKNASSLLRSENKQQGVNKNKFKKGLDIDSQMNPDEEDLYFNQLLEECHKRGIDVKPSPENRSIACKISQVLQLIKRNKNVEKDLANSCESYKKLTSFINRLQETPEKTQKKMAYIVSDVILSGADSPGYAYMRDLQQNNDNYSQAAKLLETCCSINSEIVVHQKKLPITDTIHIANMHSIPSSFDNYNPVYIYDKKVLSFVKEDTKERKTLLDPTLLAKILERTANSVPLAFYADKQGDNKVQIGFYKDPETGILMKRVSCCACSTRITEFPVFSINEQDIEQSKTKPIVIAKRLLMGMDQDKHKVLNDTNTVLNTLYRSSGDIRDLIKSNDIHKLGVLCIEGNEHFIFDISSVSSIQSLSSLEQTTIEGNKQVVGMGQIEFYLVMSKKFYKEFTSEQLKNKGTVGANIVSLKKKRR